METTITADLDRTLNTKAGQITELLKTRMPRNYPGITPDLYPLPPFIPKTIWNEVGDVVKQAETHLLRNVPGHRWISLRLDGSHFSTLMKRWRRAGIISEGHSPAFAEMMQSSCRALMVHMGAICAYTQSDEMTLLIPPANIVRGKQQPHSRNGRTVKTCTLAASYVTAIFNAKVHALCARLHIDIEPSQLPYFDCRLGHYDTKEAALLLIQWRAADCGVNGVSDAVHHNKSLGAKKVARLATGQKLQWLLEQGCLPLPPHQSRGTYFARVKRRHRGVNPKTREESISLRNTIEAVDGHVLLLSKEERLFPDPDTL